MRGAWWRRNGGLSIGGCRRLPVHRRVPSAWRRTPSGKDWLAQQNRMCKAGLAPAQGRENVYSPPIGDTIGECLSVNHDGVIDTEHHMPAQRAMYVEHENNKARGDSLTARKTSETEPTNTKNNQNTKNKKNQKKKNNNRTVGM